MVEVHQRRSLGLEKNESSWRIQQPVEKNKNLKKIPWRATQNWDKLNRNLSFINFKKTWKIQVNLHNYLSELLREKFFGKMFNRQFMEDK